MRETAIRPTIKWIKAGYLLIATILMASLALHLSSEGTRPWWLPLLPSVLFLWPAARHIRRNSTRLTLAGDKLHYETGLFAHTTRTIQLAKVQDVRVDRTMAQRLSGTGDLTIETAGETSRLTIQDIDQPQGVADRILEAAQKSFSQNA